MSEYFSSEDARGYIVPELSLFAKFAASGNKKQAAVHAVRAGIAGGVIWSNTQCDCPDDEHPDADNSIFGAGGPQSEELSPGDVAVANDVFQVCGTQPDQARMGAFPGSGILLNLAIKAAVKHVLPQIKEMLKDYLDSI